MVIFRRRTQNIRGTHQIEVSSLRSYKLFRVLLPYMVELFGTILSISQRTDKKHIGNEFAGGSEGLNKIK